MRVTGLPSGSTGGRLSSTSVTYPREGDNPGKLGLNPHRGWVVEFPHPRKCAVPVRGGTARGWGCGGLGSWRGNGPPSRRSVRAMRVGARRWTLRQGSRPYGAHQARNLRNAGNRDGGTPSAVASPRLFRSVKSSGNKGWARPVAAAAVIPAARVVAAIIGPKASVAGPVSPWRNPTAQPWDLLGILRALGPGEAEGTPGVGVKSYNPRGTASGEGAPLERVRR